MVFFEEIAGWFQKIFGNLAAHGSSVNTFLDWGNGIVVAFQHGWQHFLDIFK